MPTVFDAFVASKFLSLLTTPFEKTDAYRLGLIDKEGNILVKRDKLRTQKEKNALTIFHVLVWNIRKLLSTFPGGKTRIASLAAALFLLKESKDLGNDWMATEEEWEVVEQAVQEWYYQENPDDVRFHPTSPIQPGSYLVGESTVRVSQVTESIGSCLGVPVYRLDGKTVTKGQMVREDCSTPKSVCDIDNVISSEVSESILLQEKDYKWSAVLVDLPKSASDAVKDMASRIDDADVDMTLGHSDKPHVTVIYGLDEKTPKEIEDTIESFGPVEITFGTTSFFDDNPAYDVVKIDVESEDLKRLRKEILGEVDAPGNKYVYKPHVTVSYVAKGTGKKYTGWDDLEGKTLTLGKARFSSMQGKQTIIPLVEVGPQVNESIDYSEHPKSIAGVNKMLRDRGFGEYRLVQTRDKNDYVFVGPDTHVWYKTTSEVFRVSQMTYEQWWELFQSLYETGQKNKEEGNTNKFRIRGSVEEEAVNAPTNVVGTGAIAGTGHVDDDVAGPQTLFKRFVRRQEKAAGKKKKSVKESTNDVDDPEFDGIMVNPTKSELRRYWNVAIEDNQWDRYSGAVIRGVVNLNDYKHIWQSALETTHGDLYGYFGGNAASQNLIRFTILRNGEIDGDPATLRKVNLPSRL